MPLNAGVCPGTKEGVNSSETLFTFSSIRAYYPIAGVPAVVDGRQILLSLYRAPPLKSRGNGKIPREPGEPFAASPGTRLRARVGRAVSPKKLLVWGLSVSLQRLFKLKPTCRQTVLRINLFPLKYTKGKSSRNNFISTGSCFSKVEVLGIAKNFRSIVRLGPLAHCQWWSSSQGPGTLAALLIRPANPQHTRGPIASLCSELCGT